MPEYIGRQKNGELFSVWLSIKEFEDNNCMIESPLGELCKPIPQVFVCKVKDGGYRPQKIRPVTTNTIGSLADKNSSNSAWLSEQIEKDREQRYKEKIKSIENLEEKLGHSLPRPVLNPERPFWRNQDTVDTSLTKMTKAETEKYILEGKRPLGLAERSTKKEKE